MQKSWENRIVADAKKVTVDRRFRGAETPQYSRLRFGNRSQRRRSLLYVCGVFGKTLHQWCPKHGYVYNKHLL